MNDLQKFRQKCFDSVVTVNEIANMIGTSPDNIRMHLKAGNIPNIYYRKKQRILLFHVSYIRYHLENLKKKRKII